MIHAIVIPPPMGRESFVPLRIEDRVLELEHYFTDAFLQANEAADGCLYGSPVFRIRHGAKAKLAEAAKNADLSEFVNFTPLFARLIKMTAAGA